MMDDAAPANPLYWDTPYEIVLALCAAHTDVDPDTVGLGTLWAWITALPHFADDPALANDDMLNDILREWYEEVSGV
jgi:FeS assembly protein IscX